MKVFVISLGGSVIVPKDVDADFLIDFKKTINDICLSDSEKKFILVAGGGYTARLYQNAARKAKEDISPEALDLIGIKSTHLNAELLRNILDVKDAVVTNPLSDDVKFDGRILIAAGWKPGFSTDTDSVYLAKRFNSKLIINLSNTDYVYTSDPRTCKDAKPIERIKWCEFLDKISPKEWSAGANTPFDPVASAMAQKESINVICAHGHDLLNLRNIIENKHFKGTLISND